MSDIRFRVLCTGRGDHGRIDWPDLILGDDGSIREDRTRQAPSPVRGIVEGAIDGQHVSGPLHRKAVVPAEQHLSEGGTWRWKCPRCHLDKPLSEDHLRGWMNATTGGILDISRLPR
jgi:hypothetical protein